MMNRNKKRNIFVRLIFNSKVFFLIILIIFIAISFPVSKNINKKYKVDQEILELEKEIKALEDSNGDFKKMIIYLESDYFVEEQARLNMGLKKEGEEVVVIEEKKSDTSVGDREEQEEKRKSKEYNINSWWSHFFKK